MTRWFDPPDGWRDRVLSVVCHLFGRACRTAAVDVSEADGPSPDCGGGEAQPCAPSAWAEASSGAVPMAVPANPIESGGGGVRRRRSARSPERVGVAARAAPTTNQRSA